MRRVGLPSAGITALIVFTAIAVLLPIVGSDRWLNVAVLGLFAVLGAQALNAMIGLVGQVSIGNAAFLAIGGFAAALINMHIGGSFLIAVVGAFVVAAAVGAIAAIPAFRLRGFYLALSTIALTFAVLFVAVEIQGDQVGASGFRMPYPELFGISLDNDLAWYLLLLPMAAAATWAIYFIRVNSVGRGAQVVRDHETIAPVFGISTRKMKTVVFAISSGVIGLEGALAAYYVGTVHVENYTLLVAIEYLAMVVIGGLGSAIGVAIGALLISSLPFILDDGLSSIGISGLSTHTADLTLIVTGGILIAFLLWQPRGLAGLPALMHRLIARWRSRGVEVEAEAGGTTSDGPAVEEAVPEPVVRRARERAPDEAEPLLAIEDLTVTYANGVTAVRGVDLRCAPGSVTLIVGANGAGKTTLLRALTGTLSSEKITLEAEVHRYRGQTLLNRTPDDLTAAGITLVPERTKVFPGLTASENLDLVPRRLSEAPTAFVTRDEVLELLPRLATVAKTSAELLSGGEKQMVAIGRALLTQPKLLVIDELSLGLSPVVVRDLLETVGRIARELGVTVVLVEQAVRAALPVADRVVVLRHGSVVVDIPADEWSADTEAALIGREEAVR